MNKKGFIKLGLFFIIFLAIITILYVIPSSAVVNPGDLGYGCEGNPCPAWVNITKGDMFFTDGNDVYIVVNYSCNSTSVCNESMTVTGNFSEIGGSSNRVGVFKENATDGSWAIFELNDTVNFSAYPGAVPFMITAETIYFNATDGNSTDYNDQLNATAVLVNMTYPPGCPPPSEPLPTQIPLLNGTMVNIGACWGGNCTVDDRAQTMNSTHYAICGPTFGGDTTNFTALADTGNFSNFNLIIDIPGKAKINYTTNVSMDTPEKSQALFEFAVKNIMAGPKIGINDTEWGGSDPNKPNLNLSAQLTIYNLSSRFGINGRPQIFRYGHAQTSGIPCPPSICSNFIWDGENLTFTVTSFSDYGLTDAINVTLQSPSNLSYVNTQNINFTYTPEWNSSVNMDNCTLYGNFTGSWLANETNQSALVNGTTNWINNTVASDGPYSWNIYCYDNSSQYDYYSINWTVSVDTINPTWSNPSNVTPITYSTSTLSGFNTTWNDGTDIDIVLITITNSTGSVLINNASMTNDTYTGSVYNYSVILPAGTWNWTSYANDTVGNWNSSTNYQFTISQADSPLVLSNNESWSATYPSSTNTTGSGCPSGVTCNLFRNDTGSVSNPDLVLLGVGSYNYVYNTSGNTNYSANSTSNDLTISQGTPTTILEWNDSSPVDIGSIINFTSYASDTVLATTLYANFSGNLTNISTVTIGINSNITDTSNLALGVYQVSTNSTGNANYSDNSTLETITFTLFDASPTYSLNSTSSTEAGTTVSHNLYWQDNVGLSGYIFSFDNCTGSFVNDNWTSITGTANWTNITKTINSTLDCTVRWNISANDTSNNWTSSTIYTYNTTDTMNPTYSDNSTNTTLAGIATLFSLKWTDNSGLSGYIFSFKNCSSSNLTNETWQSFSGTWSNFTHTPNYTANCNISWKVYANDTSGNWNSTDIMSYLTKNASGLYCSQANQCIGGYCVHNVCRAASTHCEDGYCDSGENCRSDDSYCSSGYICTNGCVAEGGTTSGTTSGISGTSISRPYITFASGGGKVNITMASITTGGKMIANIARYKDVAIRGMNITVVNNVGNIKIMISKLQALPSTVAYGIDGNVYHYINIERINITDSAINTVYLEFAVNKTWLTDNNVDASNITLYRWANNQWNDLNATKMAEGDKEVFYHTTSPGLSVFIIGTTGGAPEIIETLDEAECIESWSCTDWSECTDETQTRTCTDSNNCGTTANKPAESKACEVGEEFTGPTTISILANILIIIVAIIVCVFIFLYRARITSFLEGLGGKFNKPRKKSTKILMGAENIIKEVEETER